SNIPISTVLPTDKGRIVDVITVLPTNDGLIVICSDGNLMRVATHLRKYIIMDDVRLHDISSMWSVFTCVFENAAIANSVKSESSIMITSHPANVEHWFKVIVHKEKLAELEELLNTHSVRQLSEENYNDLRIHSGFGAFSKEWTEEYNPLEANLLHLINFKKGCYIGQEVIARLDTYKKVQRRLCSATASPSIQPGDPITVDGVSVGVITSVASGTVGQRNCLCYIRAEYVSGGQQLMADSAVFTITNVITTLE
ncbi:MAG: hypothetical protein JNL32_07845, partial [Candidatus Kapabacteria bacterium]|nr:hypothetical protein [Candidatus Kapabacteria bacterium]